MIQPAALPAVPGLPMLGDMLPASTAEGMEAADFGALLAIEAGSLVPRGAGPRLPVALAATIPTALPDAADLPEDGKVLPVAMPADPPTETAAPQPSPAPAIQPGRRAPVVTVADSPAKAPSFDPTPGASAAVRPSRSARQVSVPEPAPKPATDSSEAPAEPDPANAPLTTNPLEAAPTLALAGQATASSAATPLEPHARPHPEPAAPIAAWHAPAAVKPHEQPQGTHRSAVTAPQPALAIPPAAIALAVIAVPTTPAPLSAEPQLRLTLPAARQLPSIAIPAERPRTPDTIALIQPSAEPLAPVTSISAPAVQALSAPPAFAPADPALRPHDFTQLVDRLVAARELAAPQAFQVAVQHGEFGQVQLRFRHEGDGLTIAMTSADPDFARVVSAASAPVLMPLTTTDPSTGQGGPRSDSQSQTATSNGHSAQHRSGSPERREDRSGPADNPAPARQGEGRGTRRSGIFA